MKRDGARRAGRRDSRVVRFTPERILRQTAKRFLPDHGSRCAKCGSVFVTQEPAFLHCHYCGRMARVARASLLDQELFEIRSGLRLAS